MTLDFTDKAQYDAFVENVADAVLANFQFDDELDRNIADAIMNYRRDDLANAVVDKLIERIAKKESDNR